MDDDDGRGVLLGMELVGLAHDDADARSVQQVEDLALVGEIGAAEIAEGIARAAIALAKELIDVAGVLVCDMSSAVRTPDGGGRSRVPLRHQRPDVAHRRHDRRRQVR